jgi:hypothetical protein
MPAKELGTKYTCFKCGSRFYDLKKPEPLCPKCGADQRQSPALKAPEKRSRAAARPVEPKAAPLPEVDPEVEEDVEEGDEADEDEDDDDDEA